MADGGAAAWLPADGPGEHQSSSTPGLPAKRGPSTSAAQPVGDGGPGGYPQGPAAPPSLTPGEFLLNLLQRRPQPQVEPLPPPLTLPGGGGGGAPAGPSIGGAFGPGVPVPRPGFHEFSTSPANHFPNPPPPWPDHRVFLLENWPPTTSESRPPPLPPPGFHRHERTSHIRHSPPQGRPPGFDTHLGFPGGQFDPRNSQSRHQNQPPQQLIFGSFGTPIGAQAHRLPQTTSTLSDHEQRKASDNRNSISGNSPKSHPLHPSKSHQLQGSQVFRYPNPDNLHSGRSLFPEKEPSDGRNRAPHSNGEILDRNLQIQRLEIRSVHEEHSQRREEQIRDRGEELLSVELEESLTITEENSEASKSEAQSSRQKDYRSDFSRGHHVSSQRIRYRRRELRPRRDLATFTPQFIAIYQSLTPSEEETANQIRLLRSLERLVVEEWPNARLHLYGSCANSFGAPNSDIDVCLAIDHGEIDKSKILLRLAEILESNNLQDVQALTRARVPIVKMKDPETNISCDICINNILAVVNTKLLRDYSEIDARLRQLVLIIKHWAKARGVNDTYQGTLSSYAYVLMCIHFLQLRRPPVLPCLQDMQPTYEAKVDGIECAFFDRVEKLRHFGSRNRENIAELLWAFFSYWAYHHDYTNDVISVRTGGIISKHSKDWTRRVGNDRHLVCIEDPFELSHDLGRVVDKFTIKILREEFERAADIMQFDPNPAVHLFEPYVRPPPDHT